MVLAGSVISQLEELNINSIKIEIKFLDLRDSVQLNIQNWQYPNLSPKKDGNRITLQEMISQGKVSLSKGIKWVLASKKQFILFN